MKLIIKDSTYHGQMVFRVQGIDIYNITCTVRSQTAAQDERKHQGKQDAIIETDILRTAKS